MAKPLIPVKRLYLFSEERMVARISLSVYRQLLSGRLRIDGSKVAQIKIVELSVVGRTSEIVSVRGYCHQLQPDGRVDLSTITEVIAQTTKPPAVKSKIIDFEPRLKHRQWRQTEFWAPTSEQLSQISADVRGQGARVPLLRASAKQDVIQFPVRGRK